ncbi:MAG TPA: zf-HC2 domain-containing protein [Pyrinomonadaceae bacterium]|nr:zf-HC2 domain-containing protein [Pyrinomonadaceae bacterium]
MNETEKMNNCERAGELVAYFYGEATRAERESFDAHLAACAACRDELAAFGGVREAVGHWRAEILAHAPALSLADTFAADARREAQHEGRHKGETAGAFVVPQNSASSSLPRRSARAALREFFTLSPVWLRAGLSAAALVVCALAALAVVNAELRWDDGGLAFSTRFGRSAETKSAPDALPAPPVEKVYTQAELDKLVAERDAALRELEDTRAQLDDSREANLIAAAARLEPASAPKPPSTPTGNARRDGRAAPNAPAARQRRPRVERDEDDVPRLYDLLIEAN